MHAYYKLRPEQLFGIEVYYSKNGEMDKVEFIEFKGQKILFQDYQNEKNPEIITARLDYCLDEIKVQPPKSILLLSNVTGTYYNQGLISKMKNFSSNISPYVKASAMVGVTGITKIFFNALVKLTGRDIKAHSSLDEAKEWLVAQG